MIAATLNQPAKPRMRGVLHQWAFALSLVAGVTLVLETNSMRARLAAAMYALSVAGLFGTSAMYHRVDWRTLRGRRWMRPLDHTMIFVLIAGTYTPVRAARPPPPVAAMILIAAWSAALARAVFKLLWLDAPGWLTATVYVTVGWIAVSSREPGRTIFCSGGLSRHPVELPEQALAQRKGKSVPFRGDRRLDRAAAVSSGSSGC